MKITAYSVMIVCCLVVSGLQFTPAWGAVPPDKELAIKRKINDEMKKVLKELVKGEDVCRRLGFEFPVKEPKLTLSAVQKLADRKIREIAKVKHPNVWVQNELKKMAGKYAQWKIGDMVVVHTRAEQKLQERLRENKPLYIIIGPNRIRKEDLMTRSILHVEPNRAEETKQQDESKLHKKLMAMRESYIREIRLDKTRELFLEQGYILIAGRWTPKVEYFQKIFEAERTRYDAHIREPLAYKHYYHAGFRQFKGEWYTPEEAARLRELDRIERELQPPTFMAEMDELNSEFASYTTPVAATDDKGREDLFGDDDDDDDDAKKKKKKKGDDDDDDDPFE